MTELTQEHLKSRLSYNPETGVFIWIDPIAHNVKAGDVAGYRATRGYRAVMIRGKGYPAHRLAFLYMTGALPEHDVDHINGDTADNRWANLRSVTAVENGRNQRLPKNNTSGVLGVSWHKQCRKWVVRIRVDGKKRHVGLFDDIDAAIKAREEANKKYGFHPNHGRAFAGMSALAHP